MFVRQVKRKCSVRGCKNTECFAISKVREVGNTVIICKNCLSDALGAIDEIDPKTKSNIPSLDNTEAPPLFFNAKALGTGATETNVDDASAATPENGQENTTLPVDTEDITEETNTPVDDNTDEDVTNPTEYAADFMCPNCSKEFDSERGLKTHLRYCTLQADSE